MNKDPLVTIYITSCNYYAFLEAAIESALAQTYSNIEIIIYDDNSSDNSPSIIKRYKDYENIKIILSDQRNGLRKSSNNCIKAAKGEYILRLDADDLLHKHCIEIMMSKVRSEEEAPHFIFSNYFYINNKGVLLGTELIESENGKYNAISIPPHGACCLIKRNLFTKYGFYDEEINRQDGHELWIKVLKNNLNYAHIDLPLWFYRKHGESLSSKNSLLYRDRKILKQKLNNNQERIIAFIPILETVFSVFNPIKSGQLESLIKQVRLSNKFKEIIVSTDSKRVIEYCATRKIAVHDRTNLLKEGKNEIFHALTSLILNQRKQNEFFCIINLLSIYLKKIHFQESVNTLQLYNADSVISVYLDNGIMYKMGGYGLVPINYDSQFVIRKDRDFIYIFNGALRIIKGKNLIAGNPFGKRIAHIEMTMEESFIVKSRKNAILKGLA